MRVNDDKFTRGGKRMQSIPETCAQLPAATRPLWTLRFSNQLLVWLGTSSIRLWIGCWYTCPDEVFSSTYLTRLSGLSIPLRILASLHSHLGVYSSFRSTTSPFCLVLSHSTWIWFEVFVNTPASIHSRTAPPNTVFFSIAFCCRCLVPQTFLVADLDLCVSSSVDYLVSEGEAHWMSFCWVVE